MNLIEKGKRFFKKVGSIKFWIAAVTEFIVLSIVGYVATSKIVHGGYIPKYEALDSIAKELISVQDWWVESIVGSSIPMFLVFGIQFFLLNQKMESKQLIYSALPFIKYLSWLSGKPVLFILGTASLFFGAIMFLGVEGHIKYFWGMLIPILMFLLTFSLRYTTSIIESGEGFSSFTYQNNKPIAWFCCAVAAGCWIFADLYTPFSDLYYLWTILDE